MKVGSLFSGYGGLDMAVGGDLAWYSEVEPAACKVMEAHHPGVPNLGDITKVNWSDVPPVDVITAGYPCQPFSNAGARKGTKDERHLWPHVRDAISAIRPRAAVLENVRGHLSLGFDIVLADLADLGWSARWGVVRASDAGAPHQRARLFIVAHPASRQLPRLTQRRRLPESAQRSADLANANSPGSEAHDDGRQGRGDAGRPQPVGHSRTTQPPVEWGEHATAIQRWETITGRPSPPPTIHSDRLRLNPAFVEWMMGLPKGWVTSHSLSQSQELKMLGNGVVPQQARLALDLLAAA